ncbi:hypothetical protein [Micromonospora sp. HK10]|uniref:hypothetical protein n=1 Tax=Micromonospora sp. HK10 TaxID=1538294 RepID=UPI0018CF1AFA|nr:hypothetical protein [Micromonospora sp. HK10]
MDSALSYVHARMGVASPHPVTPSALTFTRTRMLDVPATATAPPETPNERMVGSATAYVSTASPVRPAGAAVTRPAWRCWPG